MPRPRGNDWLQDEIASLRDQQVDVVISLLTSEEEAELQLTEESEMCGAAGLRFLSFPIEDRRTPIDPESALQFIDLVSNLYQQGQTVVIHCRAGIGRASVIAAAVLATRGYSVANAFEMIARARGCSVPDTIEQRLWLERLFANS